jgi:hypothetical protein
MSGHRLKPTVKPAEKPPEKRTWLNPTWASFVVALSALLFSTYQGCKVREHDRLLVRPRMSISFEAGDNGAGWETMNAGLGPAIVNGFRVAVDGKSVSTWEDFGGSLGLTGTGEMSIPHIGATVRSGDERKLFWVTDLQQASNLVKSFERVNMELDYCSVYDECWAVSTRQVEPLPVAKSNAPAEFGGSPKWEPYPKQ